MPRNCYKIREERKNRQVSGEMITVGGQSDRSKEKKRLQKSTKGHFA